MSDKLILRLCLAMAIIACIALAVFVVIGVTIPVDFLPVSLRPQAADFYAHQMAARNTAVILVFIVALILKAKRAAAFFVLLYGVIEGFDAIIGFSLNSPGSGITPLILAIVFIPMGMYALKKVKA